MSSLAEVVFYSLIGGVFSLIGGFILLSDKKKAAKLATYATPFAAGALLAAAFLDLLSEASHVGSAETALTYALVGILSFFLLERFLRFFHHHHEHDDKKSDPAIPMIIAGDTLHNFIDGIAIAAGFLIDTTTGITVTLAVAAHEIPQEIGDFGLLIKKGMKRADVIKVNILSALATTFGAVLFYQLGDSTSAPLDVILGIVAGFFIYIAVSDIIPSIHKNEDKVLAGPRTLLLIVGVIVVGLVTTAIHDVIEGETGGHNHSESEHDEEHEDEHHDEHDEEHEEAHSDGDHETNGTEQDHEHEI